MGSSDVIVGIDLGTTNSLVAFADGSGPRVLPDARGRAIVPSVVTFAPDGTVLVGHGAREDAPPGASGRTIRSVKRLMGRSVRDAAPDLPFLTYEVVAGERDTARVRLPASGSAPSRLVSPEEVSAWILRRLKEQAEAALGHAVTRAVVTVPAYFDDAQRQATRAAGRLAGLDVVRIVPEPTAAALAYGLGLERARDANRTPTTVAVYDFGGGTFDVSILRLTPPADGRPFFFEVLSTAGDTQLGGDDLDHALAAMLARDEGAGPAAGAALVREAERVKIALSGADRVRTGTRELGRARFEALIAPFVERTLACCDRARRDASIKLGLSGPEGLGLDAVVLVGGSTRIPLVRTRVAEFFGLEPYAALDPEQVVALGAAVQARALTGGADRAAGAGSLLLDVIPLSLGLETVGGAVAKVITRNSTVPAAATEFFSTSVDGQTSIRLTVYQGEREMAADCRKLGEFHLRGLPPMPAGIPQVQVEFLVDANGVLSVRAHERRSGKRAGLQVIPNHGLTPEEVERIERESLLHAREDMTRHRVVDLVANSALDLKWIGERLQKHRGALDPAYAADLEQRLETLRGFVASARADWASVDPNAFNAAREALDRASVRLQEVSITESLRQG